MKIDELIKQTATKTETTYIVLVTPDLAKLLLELNVPNNRNITKSDFYAGQMSRGLWELNGETIKISVSGKLIDGQNRLNAIIKSKTSQLMEFRLNVPEESFETLDGGKKRILGDRLKMKNYKNSNMMAAVLKQLRGYEMNYTFTQANGVKSKATANRDGIDFSDKDYIFTLETKYKDLPNYVSSYFQYKNRLEPLKDADMIFAHYIFARYNQLKANEFIEKFINGTNLDPQIDSVIIKLRDKLIKAKGQLTQTGKLTLDRPMALWYVFQSFKRYCSGTNGLPQTYDRTIKLKDIISVEF